MDLNRGDRDMMHVCPEPVRRPTASWWRLELTGWLLAATAIACGGGVERPELPSGDVEADRLLFERGATALEEGDWRDARTYFVSIRDNYPQSQYRAEARLSIGDTYEREGTLVAYVQAIDEYQDFLSLYPTHPRAAYAQYKVGLVHFHQMRRAERDQTETKTAVREFETFITLYPDHELMPEVRERQSMVDIVASSALTRDVYQQMWRPEVRQETLTGMSRYVTLALAIVALCTALAVSMVSQGRTVFWYAIFGWSGIAATFCPVIILALSWPRYNVRGALSSMVTGFLCVPLFEFAVPQIPVWGPMIAHIEELAPSMLLAIIAGTAVTLATTGTARVRDTA